MITLSTTQRHTLLAVGIVACGIGVVCAYLRPSARWQAEALQRPPQQIALRDLAAHGPGDNPHVVVTEFVCASNYYFSVQTSKYNTGPAETREGSGQAWIPLFPKQPPAPEPPPASAEAPEPTGFVVLLETAPTLGNATTFRLLSRRQSMPGLIVPYSNASLSSDIRHELAAAYPTTNFQECLVLRQIEKSDHADVIVFAQALYVGAIAGLAFGIPLAVIGFILCRFRSAALNTPMSAEVIGDEFANRH